MNRIEYIRYSHRRANSRVRAWIGSVRMRLARRSRLLGWLWMVPASIFYALVVLFSWLTFCVVLFKDPRFTLHYLESEIECRGLSGAEARRYLDEQHRDYERRLAYGNFTRDEQRRIDQTFAYLYNRYPAPAWDDLNARLDEVQSAVAEIAGFTRQRQEELEQARERETALQAQAEKRRAINRSRTGFDPAPEDFSPRLTDRQLDLLTEHINRIGLFRRDVTRPEVELLFACQLPEPLQTTHNKLLALLLESLSAARFITPKWQRVAGAKGSSSRSWASRLRPRISRRPSRWPTSSTRNASNRFSTASGPWKPRSHSLPTDTDKHGRCLPLRGSVVVFAGCQFAGNGWERLSKQAETLADNVASLFSSFLCLCNYKPVRCATPLSNLLNCVFMQMSLTVEERLDRIEQLLRGQKNVLNFSEACDFTGISPSYMYKLTHSARIPHYKPHGKNVYFLREELEQWLLQNPVRTAEQKDREATEFVLRKRRPR